MKNTALLILASLFCFAACQPAADQPAAEPEPVDVKAVTTELGMVLDQYHQTMMNMEADAMTAYFTDDALICGTDPGELWDREQLASAVREMAASGDIELNYSIDTREVRLSDDGKGAVVAEQMTIDFISPHIPVRMTHHLLKKDDGWKMNFTSLALIPKNEDLPKINGVFEEME